MRFFRYYLLMAAVLHACLTLFPPAGFASDTPLHVATKESPPFSFKGPNGTWTGISIELWEKIAAQLGITYEFHEISLQSMLTGLEAGSVDAAVAALTINAEREARMDFSHPFYITGLGIATRTDGGMGWVRVLERFVSIAFLKVVALLTCVLLVFGLLVWFFERRVNPDQFSADSPKGLWSGFWWAAVTMTTVGYGDKAPISVGGRIVALIWMFTAIIIISSFTAAITSTLTVNQLGQNIRSAEDLAKVRVATVQASTSTDYLTANRISFTEYDGVTKALDALESKSVTAVVYDEAILRYFIREHYKEKMVVLPETLEPQNYGIGLPAGSRLREPINRALLHLVGTPWWNDLIYKYLGK